MLKEKQEHLSLWRSIWRGEDLSEHLKRIEREKSTGQVRVEDLFTSAPSKTATPLESTGKFSGLEKFTSWEEKQIRLSEKKDKFLVFTKTDLRLRSQDFKEIYALLTYRDEDRGLYRFEVPVNEANSFLMRHLFNGTPMRLLSKETLEELRERADKAPIPEATIDKTGKFIIYKAPKLFTYDQVAKKVGARPFEGGYRVPISKSFDFLGYAEGSSDSLPAIAIDPKLEKSLFKEIKGFDGKLETLKSIDLSELSSVSANHQTWAELKSSKKSLKEKLSEYGEDNLYDVIFNIPRRYIDKSEPQSFSSLIPGEECTIVGKISSSYLMTFQMRNGRQGKSAKFTVELPPRGQKIEVTFWGQHWLMDKFKPGDEVVITGKVGFFGKKKTIGGSSIDPADDTSILPIVPIYKQSGKLGLTTAHIMSASRELFNRLEGLENPSYLPDNFGSLQEALKNIHFPQKKQDLIDAKEFMAKLELLYTQVELQEYRSRSAGVESVLIPGDSKKDFMNRAIAGLPYELTGAQKRAIAEMSELVNSSEPMNVLLNADVGAGKTVTSQSVCLKAAESGYQSAMVAPTETLAVQLYANLEKFIRPLGSEVRIAYLSGLTKARERTKILKELASGEIDILVGTHSLFSDSVVYKNLGLVVFDEQQKFGVEHRDKLLKSREDKLSPHFLMQSATPMPASIAQVFYGDLKAILLDEKPAGRKEIITQHFEIPASEILSDAEINHEVWVEVRKEAAVGNQTFIVTPMVKDSDKIDAASVEESYKLLTKGALKNLNVGYIHGQMKKEKAAQVMQDFKDKKLDVLIGSTVVEVGVDVPDATRVVILSADRFGASTLHQIRGRVGRNDKLSKCFLIAEEGKGTSRLEAMVRFSDGFDIAQADLETRNEGVVFSTEQSGSPAMRFASILTHRNLIDETKDIALKIWSDKTSRAQALHDSKLILKLS